MSVTHHRTIVPGDLDLRGRSFTKELDVSFADWRGLLDLSAQLKRERRTRDEAHWLAGLNFALVFAKTSTRTRCAFEVAAHDQGAHVTYIDPSGSQLGHKESVKDTGRVLGRTFDGIEYRGFGHEDVEVLARHSGVPVWNGLSDLWHPTQSLCDVFTMEEHSTKPLTEVSVAYVGDARNNVARSLLVAGAMSGMEVRMVAPRALATPRDVWAVAEDIARETGARLMATDDPREGVWGVDFVYTDVWLSMGESHDEWTERIDLLRPYRVDHSLMLATRNPAAKFMHCLPAFHDAQTGVGAEVLATMPGETCLEVSDAVFESPASIVFDQAENRMHTVKAVMVATAGVSGTVAPGWSQMLPD
ncbi:MAG TPA: ornithine carbamoyltransferase [Nocardioides sp.]|uniref:ornithine carbamoyltransferase n=1 Tax=uncultured Nocardioides sp. TaxID=198441 RepID=UPI000EE7157A|nr:ornithine carbamoyltransferase [uncultured Nocardioides sp.]HCB06703.1 ornithine carbamoyltransferase [Nocardioides sp.]HRD59838.1 ornithine carbamoyltransferase [Nocardioides sp.]HRI95174.1 ornithine carbamoyltransferase [Nocardioides sp.]HRK45639.1 ornithine carbamoyltransferase [Nocardioides sp.]